MKTVKRMSKTLLATLFIASIVICATHEYAGARDKTKDEGQGAQGVIEGAELVALQGAFNTGEDNADLSKYINEKIVGAYAESGNEDLIAFLEMFKKIKVNYRIASRTDTNDRSLAMLPATKDDQGNITELNFLVADDVAGDTIKNKDQGLASAQLIELAHEAFELMAFLNGANPQEAHEQGLLKFGPIQKAMVQNAATKRVVVDGTKRTVVDIPHQKDVKEALQVGVVFTGLADELVGNKSVAADHVGKTLPEGDLNGWIIVSDDLKVISQAQKRGAKGYPASLTGKEVNQQIAEINTQVILGTMFLTLAPEGANFDLMSEIIESIYGEAKVKTNAWKKHWQNLIDQKNLASIRDFFALPFATAIATNWTATVEKLNKVLGKL